MTVGSVGHGPHLYSSLVGTSVESAIQKGFDLFEKCQLTDAVEAVMKMLKEKNLSANERGMLYLILARASNRGREDCQAAIDAAKTGLACAPTNLTLLGSLKIVLIQCLSFTYRHKEAEELAKEVKEAIPYIWSKNFMEYLS